MKKEDDSEKKLWCLLDMVIKNCGCVKEVIFSYIFILFSKQIVLLFLTSYYLYYPI